MNTKRVVITGIGVVSPVGNSIKEAWENIKAGVSGIGWITIFEPSSELTRVAGEVRNFDGEALFGSRVARRTDRAQQFGLYAAQQALEDSQLKITDDNTYDIGCILGTGVGGITTLHETLRDFMSKGRRGVSPLSIPRILGDSIASRISMEFKLRGPSYAVTSACATGNNAIGDAFDLIRMGRARAVVTGGAEAAITDMVVAGFRNMTALSAYDNPDRACRPFDLNRDGFVISEGAAALVLEEMDHALERGAQIYAELTGYGHTSDAFHVTAPLDTGEGAVKAMQRALAEAEIEPDAIDYINAHGTSTPLNDKSETLAIKKTFGERAYNIPVSSTKSMTGHMLGAAGAIEAIFSILAMRDSFVPPTINLETPDPECDLDYVPNVGREHHIDHAMSYSAGFGGHNTALIFSRFNGR